MNNKINLDNTKLREYIQLLESTGASRESLSAFFKETYGVDFENFNTQFDLVNRVKIDNMNRKLAESEQESDIDVDKVFTDEPEQNLLINDEDKVWAE